MKDAIIRIRGLRFGYRPEKVLFSDLDIDIQAGAFVGILGPNGSGKTTLIRLMTGLLRPQAGQVLIDGRPVHTYLPAGLARKIAVVSQGSSIPAGFSAAETVLMARVGRVGMKVFLGRADLEIARSSLRITGIEHLAGRRLDQLSGGELQRVFLARAFAQQADVVMLDEPTAYLDIQHQIHTYELLKAAQAKQGKTILVVTHDLCLADRYCDLVLLLRLSEQAIEPLIGTPRQILTVERIGQVFGIPVACGLVAGHRVFTPLPVWPGQKENL